VWAVAGLGKWVDSGGVFDKSVTEGSIDTGAMPFPEVLGSLLHGNNGVLLIAGLALCRGGPDPVDCQDVRGAVPGGA
jgi:hypothetical protein